MNKKTNDECTKFEDSQGFNCQLCTAGKVTRCVPPKGAKSFLAQYKDGSCSASSPSSSPSPAPNPSPNPNPAPSPNPQPNPSPNPNPVPAPGPGGNFNPISFSFFLDISGCPANYWNSNTVLYEGIVRQAAVDIMGVATLRQDN